ncbi:MAG: hypothetical protein GXY36_08355 [Chloroflexi bacterium]|nr:hypothetical protein [Chloroflexota bacterium]
MVTEKVQTGRVLRVGRGWVDVTIERRVCRIVLQPNLAVRAGSYLKIVNNQAVALQGGPEQVAAVR